MKCVDDDDGVVHVGLGLETAGLVPIIEQHYSSQKQ